MAHSLDFEGKPAFFIRCPVCKATHIGGDPVEDAATEQFMRSHSNWHEHSNSAPPAKLVVSK